MPNRRLADGRPFGDAIHATAISIAGQALLIVGPSRSGKSRLALALIAASTRQRPIRLVGDDRVLLARRRGRLVARAHPRIEGFIECRGLGILAVPFEPSAPVLSLVDLGSKTPKPPGTQNFPCLQYVMPQVRAVADVDAAVGHVLGWWRDASTTLVTETDRDGRVVRKRLELVTKPRSYIPPAGTRSRFTRDQ